jgi:hypothetical protein
MMAGASWQRTHLERGKQQGSRLLVKCASQNITSLLPFEGFEEEQGWSNFERIHNLNYFLNLKTLKAAFLADSNKLKEPCSLTCT